MTDLVGAVVSSVAVGIVIGWFVRGSWDGVRAVQRRREAKDAGMVVHIAPAPKLDGKALARLGLLNQGIRPEGER